MRRASGSVTPLRSRSSSILTLRQAPTQWPQYTCPPDFLRGYPVVGLTLESGSDLARRSDKRPAHDAARWQEVSMMRATTTTTTQPT